MKCQIKFTDELRGVIPVQKPYFGYGIPSPVKEFESKFFRSEEEKPCLINYQIKGAFKNAAAILNRSGDGKLSKELKKFRAIIDGGIFIYPRNVILNLPDGKSLGKYSRHVSLRTTPNTSLIEHMETVPVNTTIQFDIKTLENYDEVIKEWLDYLSSHGFYSYTNHDIAKFIWKQI